MKRVKDSAFQNKVSIFVPSQADVAVFYSEYGDLEDFSAIVVSMAEFWHYIVEVLVKQASQ